MTEQNNEFAALLPCPFCGGRAEIYGFVGKYIACAEVNDCYAAMGENYDRDAMDDHMYTEEQAIERWNTRRAAPLPADRARALAWFDSLMLNEVVGVNSQNDDVMIETIRAALSQPAQEGKS